MRTAFGLQHQQCQLPLLLPFLLFFVRLITSPLPCKPRSRRPVAGQVIAARKQRRPCPEMLHVLRERADALRVRPKARLQRAMARCQRRRSGQLPRQRQLGFEEGASTTPGSCCGGATACAVAMVGLLLSTASSRKVLRKSSVLEPEPKMLVTFARPSVPR